MKNTALKGQYLNVNKLLICDIAGSYCFKIFFDFF